jgi:hypothetical protein
MVKLQMGHTGNDIEMTEHSLLLESVMRDLRMREKKGYETYGTTMDRTDLTQQEWLQHAYEEALDLALYLKKIIKQTK